MNVSVVVCVKDGERWIADALDSVVGQDRPPDEIVVVDDGSRDESMAIVSRYDVRMVPGPARGVGAAHTVGFEAARGDAVGILGQDDVYVPGALRALAEALEHDDDAGLAAGRAELFTADAPFSGLRADRLGTAHETRLPETVLIRSTVLKSLLPLANDAAWDVDLFLRLDERKVPIARVDAQICRKRLRPDSAIHAGTGQQRQMLNALRESIVRRREATEQ